MERLGRELATDLGRLGVRGCPLEVVKYLGGMKAAVLDVFRERARVYRPEPGMKLVLPVVPFSVADARVQMAMVMTTMTSGVVKFTNPGRISNESYAPKGPYWCILVKDGRSCCDLTLAESLGAIYADDRVPLNAEQGIALAIHRQLGHGIDLPGSRYRKETNEETGEVVEPELVPAILPGIKAQPPELTYVEEGRGAFAMRGVPSRDQEIVE